MSKLTSTTVSTTLIAEANHQSRDQSSETALLAGKKTGQIEQNGKEMES